MEISYDIIVAGHVCLDMTPRFPSQETRDMGSILTPGKLVNIGEVAMSTGGAVSNTGLALVKLGLRTGLMGKTANDLFGDGIRSVFAGYGAEKALTVVENDTTSYSVVLAPPGIDRVILHYPGTNDTFCADDVNYDLVKQSRAFHFGYPPLMRRMYTDEGSELTSIFRRVKSKGTTTSLDMSLPDPDSESGQVDWQAILARLLPYVDIAPLSAEEAMFMLRRKRFDEIRKKAGQTDPLELFSIEDFTEVAGELLDLGAPVVLLKCGCRGLLLRTAAEDSISAMGTATPADPGSWAGQNIWKNSYIVPSVLSATGAGDSAIAGFLCAFLNGCGPEVSLSSAACVGAQNIQTLDTLSGIKTWEQTLELIESMQCDQTAPGAGWEQDRKFDVWRKI